MSSFGMIPPRYVTGIKTNPKSVSSACVGQCQQSGCGDAGPVCVVGWPQGLAKWPPGLLRGRARPPLSAPVLWLPDILLLR